MHSPIVGVSFAGAARNDAAAIGTLLEGLPDEIAASVQAALGEMVGKGFQGMRYDAGTCRAFFIACDPAVLTCWTLGGVTLEQSTEIWAALEDERTLNDDSVVQAYRNVTGYAVQEVVRH
jgi:hypothetical protein